jgi:type IV pilus assembly protein PilB
LIEQRIVEAVEWDRWLAQSAGHESQLEARIWGRLTDTDGWRQALARQLGAEVADEIPEHVEESLCRQIPTGLARRYRIVPWRETDAGLDILCSRPLEPELLGTIRFALGRPVRLVVADPAAVERLLAQHYDLPASSGDGFAAAPVAVLEEPGLQTSVVHLVNLVLAQAVRDHASDIHFEPFEQELKIRYRIDGALYEMNPAPVHLARPIASRLKVLAQLDIAERRVPQDGRVKVDLGGRRVDLRISTLPTQYGESVVLRVLDQDQVQLSLEALGLPVVVVDGLRAAVQRPHGLVVVTGPTGSGKTTTLYSALAAINDVSRKVLTVEDPVEFELDGIMQVGVNRGAGLTFARSLRAFLRQDPDVILVGEIRDAETAQIAVQAALTGHLVLSSLHTNDAPGAINRLIDLGVEPFLMASALEAVLAQRLVRRICPRCAMDDPAANLWRDRAGLPAKVTLRKGRGCPHCHGTGYRGRLALAEWLPVNERMREMLGGSLRHDELRTLAGQAGLRTLRQEGVAAAVAGATTLEEVFRYC